MTRLHCQHLKADINHYLVSTTDKMVDKQVLTQEMVDKWSIKPSLAEKMVDILEYVADKDEITTEQIVSHLGFCLHSLHCNIYPQFEKKVEIAWSNRFFALSLPTSTI